MRVILFTKNTLAIVFLYHLFDAKQIQTETPTKMDIPFNNLMDHMYVSGIEPSLVILWQMKLEMSSQHLTEVD